MRARSRHSLIFDRRLRSHRELPCTLGGPAAFRGPLIAALCVVLLFGIVTIAATTGRPLHPVLAFDGASYVVFAKHVLKTGRLPPLELRPPLYPLVIAAFMAVFGESAFQYVVFFQAGCWIVSALLVTLLTFHLARRAALGALAGILYVTLSEPHYHIRLIYAEALGTALTLAGVLLFIEALRRTDASGRPLCWAAALVAAGAAYARPILQLLLPLFGVVVILDSWITRRPVRARLAPFVAAVLVALAPWYVGHRFVRGAAFFTKGFGYVVTNYLGDRRLIGHFPAQYAELERAYATRFAAKPDERYLAWWDVYPEWPRIYERRTGSRLPPDLIHADMARTAVAVLIRNPGYVVSRWSETWREFSTSPGWKPSGLLSPIRIFWPAWNLFFTYLGLWLPFAILAAELVVRPVAARHDIARVVPIATYLAMALVSTAIEPWPGQVRYRAPLDGLLLAGWIGGLPGWTRALTAGIGLRVARSRRTRKDVTGCRREALMAS